MTCRIARWASGRLAPDVIAPDKAHGGRERPHQGIGQQIPVSGERARIGFAGSVTAIPFLGGLHRDYCAAA
jgi:hypothetical protein